MSGRSDLPPVVVLLGGPSAEHDVSIVSGTAVADALRDVGHDVTQVLIDLAGRWWWLPAEHRRGGRPQAGYDDPAALGADGPIDAGAAIDRLAAIDPRPVVFVALHGPFGEDGTVQALLEAADLPYTGSGVTASAVGMDKAIFKRLVGGLGLPIVDWLEVTAARWEDSPGDVLREIDAFADASPSNAAASVRAGGRRLMVKPARLGSSVGMTLVHDASARAAEVAAALEEAFRFDTLALVERYVAAARDVEVAVIGNEPDRLDTYGPGEIFSGHEFYDYVAKYSPGVSRTTIEADLAVEVSAAIREMAADAYRAIGAEGFARVDFLVAGDDVWVSEINTIPGFTPISLFPTMPSSAGLDFLAVTERILDLALERDARRVRRTLTPGDLPR